MKECGLGWAHVYYDGMITEVRACVRMCVSVCVSSTRPISPSYNKDMKLHELKVGPFFIHYLWGPNTCSKFFFMVVFKIHIQDLKFTLYTWTTNHYSVISTSYIFIYMLLNNEWTEINMSKRSKPQVSLSTRQTIYVVSMLTKPDGHAMPLITTPTHLIYRVLFTPQLSTLSYLK